MLGTAPINPFMSFTSLKESMGVDEQMSDSHLDPNFQVVLKKMNKKDGVTKLKVKKVNKFCKVSSHSIHAVFNFKTQPFRLCKSFHSFV